MLFYVCFQADHLALDNQSECSSLGRTIPALPALLRCYSSLCRGEALWTFSHSIWHFGRSEACKTLKTLSSPTPSLHYAAILHLPAVSGLQSTVFSPLFAYPIWYSPTPGLSYTLFPVGFSSLSLLLLRGILR